MDASGTNCLTECHSTVLELDANNGKICFGSMWTNTWRRRFMNITFTVNTQMNGSAQPLGGTSDVVKRAPRDAMAQRNELQMAAFWRGASEAVTPLFTVVMRVLLVPLCNHGSKSLFIRLWRNSAEPLMC